MEANNGLFKTWLMKKSYLTPPIPRLIYWRYEQDSLNIAVGVSSSPTYAGFLSGSTWEGVL